MIVTKDMREGVFSLDGQALLARIVQKSSLQTNAGRMSCRVVMSTQDEDRSGDVVVTKGIILDDHKKNPVALLNHDKNAPIGRFMDRMGNYTVHLRTPTELVGEIYFNQSSQFACDVFTAVENKVFSAVSIGFLPVGVVQKNHNGRGNVYSQSRLVEGSVLTIGDNQNAIVEAVERGFHGKQICKELKAMLAPMITEPKPVSVVGGYGSVKINGVEYVPAPVITKGADGPKRGCLVAPLSGAAAKMVLDAGKSIADDDLAEKGRETDPHVTVRYGFMPSAEISEIERIALPYGPLGFTLGPVGVFAGSEHDVVYYSVNRPSPKMMTDVPGNSTVPTAVYPDSGNGLWDLHEALGDLPHEDTHPNYIAHACIAYVKPGLGEKYAKMIGYPRSGIGCFVSELVYSDSKKERTIIPLVGTKGLRTELNKPPFDPETIGKAFDESKHDRGSDGRWVSGGDDTSSLPSHSPAHIEADHGSLERVMGKGEHVEANVSKLLEAAGPQGLRMRDIVKRLNKGGSVYGDITEGHVRAVLDSMEVHYRDDRIALSKHVGGDSSEKSKRLPSFPYVRRQTYLQRMRIKAMNPLEDDDTLAGNAADAMPTDDTLPVDPNASPVDDGMGTDDMDAMTDAMKPFAQMCHTAHEQLMQIVQGLEDALGDTEHPKAAKLVEGLKADVGKALSKIVSAYGDYKSAHPDQPDIPGAASPSPDMGDDADDDMESDDSDDELPADDDAGDEIPSGDDEGDDKEEKDDSKEKAWAGYAVQCFNRYWDHIHTKALRGDRDAMDKAAKLLDAVARDKKQPMERRKQAQAVCKQLRGGGVVTKAAPASDEWSAFAGDLDELTQRLGV